MGTGREGGRKKGGRNKERTRAIKEGAKKKKETLKGAMSRPAHVQDFCLLC